MVVGQIALFNSGIVLVLNLWANKHSSAASSQSKKDLEDVFKVLTMLKHLEPRINIAAKVRYVALSQGLPNQ